MGKALTKQTEQPIFNEEQIELIRVNLMPANTTADDFKIFLYQCERTKLDPFNRQIYAMSRWDNNKKQNVTTAGVTIDGLRLIAERTGKYQGQGEPMWCGKDGDWKDVWVYDAPPVAAKVLIHKQGFIEPIVGVAKFSTYARKTREGKLFSAWAQMPDLMLSKCAEALALRKAFPQDTSGLYTSEEMGVEVVEVKQTENKVRPRNEKSPNEKKESDFAPSSDFEDITDKPATKQDAINLNEAAKQNGWKRIEVTEAMDMLYSATSVSQLTYAQCYELNTIVSNNNPEEGAKIIVDIANKRVT